MTTNGPEGADLKTAVFHFQRGQFDAAEPTLRALAAQDDPRAMYFLGGICRMRDRDEAAARRWFTRGASLGNAQCMFEVGTSFLAEADFDSARLWLERAAAAGVVSAMLNLGSALINSGNREGARTWWQRAAKEGNATEKDLAKRILSAYFPS
jgi:TPR repeat protein